MREASQSFRSPTPLPVTADNINTFSKSYFLDNSLARSKSRSGGVKSSLFNTNETLRPDPAKLSRIAVVSSSTNRRAQSCNNNNTSPSLAPCQAALTIARSNRRFGLKIPGVSTKISCTSSCIAMPRIRLRVVCTLGVTIDTFCPTIAFIKVDFPAFGAPIKATKPALVISLSLSRFFVLQPILVIFSILQESQQSRSGFLLANLSAVANCRHWWGAFDYSLISHFGCMIRTTF